jgi:hypothetical protein
MEAIAVSVFPIAKLGEWKEFVDEASTGKRSNDHKSFLRRLGIKREHIRHMPTPEGDFAIIIWEGIDQDQIPNLMGSLTSDPQSDHEAYIANHVIPNLHGVDVGAGPPPEIKKLATTDS